jgi:hypothetical protein
MSRVKSHLEEELHLHEKEKEKMYCSENGIKLLEHQLLQFL